MADRSGRENEISVSETDTEITLKASDFTYAISKRTGLFTKLQYAGRDYLNHPMELNIWRAPTDNDMYIRANGKTHISRGVHKSV